MTHIGEPNLSHIPVIFLSEFRNLNKQLKDKPYPIPKINEILLKLEGFKCAMSLHLKIGYDHIRITEDASNLCRIIIPWGTYHFKNISMVVSNSPAIFQHK